MVTPAILAGFFLFFSLVALLGTVGIVPAQDEAGNRIDIGPFGLILLIPTAVILLLGAIIFIAMMFDVTKQYRIYDKGILFPFKSLSDHIRRKEAFLPFEDIEEIFTNDSSAALSFAVRTKKGYLEGKKKQNVWKGMKKHGSSWPMMVVLLNNGKVMHIQKEEFNDLIKLTRILEEKVRVNIDEYYLP